MFLDQKLGFVLINALIIIYGQLLNINDMYTYNMNIIHIIDIHTIYIQKLPINYKKVLFSLSLFSSIFYFFSMVYYITFIVQNLYF